MATLTETLYQLADPGIAEHSQGFFKTGPGEYGEGDRFLGIRVPEQRKVARRFRNLSLDELESLLQSEWHELRLTALFILVLQYQKGDAAQRVTIFHFYIRNLDRVNNWDLADSSAGHIAGHYLFDKDRSLLFDLAESENIWKRRVAIIATGAFISHEDLEDTFRISEMLLNDPQDLIHKAVGWMIRETGKKDREAMEAFLLRHYRQMPRTMLRYAIEHLPKERRKEYLEGKALT
ncbi:MAG: DNA alkylation repair protein [Balneolaceae bacterium]|nr:DNA alkylation repair protein [Balneolaceae bacterium]MCH8549497.1 DNA alkylation repair protein [Balneolaceae bacterium]